MPRKFPTRLRKPWDTKFRKDSFPKGMCQIEKFGASPFRYVRTDIEVHGEERVLTVHNRAAIPIITKRFACYDTPSFYSPVRKEPRYKKQKNRKIQDKQGQAHDRAPKKRSQERESETKPKQKKRGDYRHSYSYSYSYSYSSTLPSGLLRHELRNVSEPAKENPAHIECGVFFSQILKTAKSEP